MTSSPALHVAAPSRHEPHNAEDAAHGAGSFCHSAGVRWHYLAAGRGPRLLLLHGTGSACASWNRMVAELAGRFDVLAPDLPGHGCSTALPAGQSGIDAFAAAISTLLTDQGKAPDIIVGHSAGAAIAARMALADGAERTAVLSINGALRPLAGWSALAFVPLAKLLGASPFVARRLAHAVATDPRAARRLLDATGSRIDAGMIAFYESLLRSPAHVAGTLRMLSNWDLRGLLPDLPRLGARLTLVAAAGDRTVSPRDAQRVHDAVPGSRLLCLPALGHLAHEEAPAVLARAVEALARERGLLDPGRVDGEPRP